MKRNAFVLALVVLASGLGAGGRVPAAEESAVLLAAGDVASCDGRGDTVTGRLLQRRAGTVALLGDGAYRSGSPRDYARCYDPTWGAVKARTRPAPGNHDYNTPGAAGYFGYFGERAGKEDQGGYYSYDLGAWHIVALNSNCGEVGGCGPGSPQEQWLRADLAANPAACTLAYWHHARFSSGTEHGNTDEVAPLWEALDAAGAEIVLSAHEHTYERFAPQDADGNAAPEGGIRQFVVGTGGAERYEFGTPLPNSEARGRSLGVLKLVLRPDGYAWRFLAAGNSDFTDAGAASCR